MAKMTPEKRAWFRSQSREVQDAIREDEFVREIVGRFFCPEITVQIRRRRRDSK